MRWIRSDIGVIGRRSRRLSVGERHIVVNVMVWGIVAYMAPCKLGILILIINVEEHLGTFHVQEVGR